MRFGQQVEGRSGRTGQLVERAVRRPRRRARRSGRRRGRAGPARRWPASGQGPATAPPRWRPRHRLVSGDPRRVARIAPGRRRGRPEHNRMMRPAPVLRAHAAGASTRGARGTATPRSAARPSSSGHATRAARSSARPCRRDAARCAGDGVRASASASIAPQKPEPLPAESRAQQRRSARTAPSVRAHGVTARAHAAAASPAATSPAVRSRPRRNASSERQVAHGPRRHRRLNSTRMRVPPGRKPRVRQQQRRHAHRDRSRSAAGPLWPIERSQRPWRCGPPRHALLARGHSANRRTCRIPGRDPPPRRARLRHVPQPSAVHHQKRK